MSRQDTQTASIMAEKIAKIKAQIKQHHRWSLEAAQRGDFQAFEVFSGTEYGMKKALGILTEGMT